MGGNGESALPPFRPGMLVLVLMLVLMPAFASLANEARVILVRRVLPGPSSDPSPLALQVESDTSRVMGARSIVVIGMFHRSSAVSSKRIWHCDSPFHSPSTAVGYSTAHVLPSPTPRILRIFSGGRGRVGYLGSPWIFCKRSGLRHHPLHQWLSPRRLCNLSCDRATMMQVRRGFCTALQEWHQHVLFGGPSAQQSEN